jgi:hypothetical protein
MSSGNFEERRRHSLPDSRFDDAHAFLHGLASDTFTIGRTGIKGYSKVRRAERIHNRE